LGSSWLHPAPALGAAAICELMAGSSSMSLSRSLVVGHSLELGEVSSGMLPSRLRSSAEEEPSEMHEGRSEEDEYGSVGVNSQLPILAVGRVSDIKVLGHAFSDDLDAEQQRLCYAMVDKIVKRCNKLIKELQDSEDAGRQPPHELKKLAWTFPEEAEEGCFMVKLDEARTFIYIVFAMSRYYPEKLVNDLFRELADKVMSLVTDDDFVAEESVTHNLLPKMAKLVQSFETTNFETWVKSVERASRRVPLAIQVNVAPPSRPRAGRTWTCVRKVIIYTIVLGMLGGGIYAVLHFTVFARRGEVQAISALIV